MGKDPTVVPLSCQRVLSAETKVETHWIGPDQAKKLTPKEIEAYTLAHQIMMHLSIEAPLKHKSGHPGGPLSAFTFTYALKRRRNPASDAGLRMSAGHLSLLAYGLQYLGGTDFGDERLSSPQAIIDNFRIPKGLPGHAEAGIGDIPFGCGPLGKGLSSGLGHAFGWKELKKTGMTDVLMGDGDAQEGQILEAARLAPKLGADHLMLHADINDVQLSSIPSKVAASDLASIFSAMGWEVIEVQNGNDPAQVEAALDLAETLVGGGRPILLCYYTTMGHGVETMEKASNAGLADYHGAPMKPADAERELKKLPPLAELTKSYEPHRKDFLARAKNAIPQSEKLSEPKKTKRIVTKEKGAARKDFGAVHVKALMESDSRIYVLHGDLAGSGGFDEVEKKFPTRVINCGAAEANMYMMAAGMRQAGLIPITYTFAAFGTNEARANARLIDINAGHIPCSILNDCTHAGLSVGEDGETHQDRNYFNIPFDHTQVWMPVDSNQAGAMAEHGLNLVADGKQSVYVFSPRSGHPQILKPDGSAFYDEKYAFEGKMDVVAGRNDISDALTIIAAGIPVHDALAAAAELAKESIHIRVLNAACIRPLDAASVIKAAFETSHLIVVEDHHSEGGLASQVADVIADFQLPCTLRRLGVNHYFPSGTADDLKFLAGLDTESIAEAVRDEVKTEVCGGEDAFITAIFALLERSSLSRFRESALPYISTLTESDKYLATLRAHWKSRTCAPEKMPSNEALMKRLSQGL